MKKSKIILLFSLLLLLTIFRFVQESNKKNNTFSKPIYGIIDNIQTKNDYTSFIIQRKYLAYYKGKISYSNGTKVKIYGQAQVPDKNRNFYLFNYKNYLLSKGIKYIYNVKKIEKISSKIKIKYKIKNNLNRYIDRFKSSPIMKALIIGENKIDDETMNSYRNNGISHLFAISGTHITLLTTIVLFILNKLFKNKEVSLFIIFIFLIFYIFLTGYSISVLRSSLLFIIININKILNIKIKSVYILIIIFFILLIYNPFYIYNIGFLLSFIVSFFLMISSSTIKNIKSSIKKSLYVSFISFLSSYPIIINNCFEINFLSPILNLFFAPLICFIIYPLCLICLIIKQLDIFLYKLISIFNYFSLTISKLNFFKLSFSHMNIFFIFIFYIFLFLFTYKWKKIIYIIVIFFIIHYNINSICLTPSITVIDVGQGDSILIKLYNKGSILIDTGGKFNKNKTLNISNKNTIPFLKAAGIKKLEYLVLTHGDYDHMGEAINLVNDIKIEKVIFNCGEYNELEKDLIKVLDKKKIKYYSCIKELNIDNNKLYFLQTKEYDNENDNSNVIYTELNSYKFMFMGDASVTTEKEILDKYNLSDIDVLKVGHHGSRTSSSKEFIYQINPKYSIISVGKKNRYGHPNKEVLENLQDSKIYRTDQDGSIMFKIKNNKLKIETCSP